jgi:hypothetical protein
MLLLDNISVKQQGGSWAVGITVPQPKAMFWLETQEVLCFAAEVGADDTFCAVRLSVAVLKQGGPSCLA